MTTPLEKKARPVELECGHVIWTRYYPLYGDVMWCARCDNYEPPAYVNAQGEVYHADEQFVSRRIRQNYTGECRVGDCRFVPGHNYKTYGALRDAILGHIMREHTRHGRTLELEDVPRPNYKGEPPF